MRVDVVGPVCETGDFLALDRTLPDVARRRAARRARRGRVRLRHGVQLQHAAPAGGGRWWTAARWWVARPRETVDELFRRASRHDRRPTLTASEYRRRGPASRRHPDHRFRLAVHPAHRAPGARGARLLRDPPAVPHGRVDPGLEAQGHHPVGRPELGLRRERAHRRSRRCSSWARRCSASATACSSLAHLSGGKVKPAPTAASTAAPA